MDTPRLNEQTIMASRGDYFSTYSSIFCGNWLVDCSPPKKPKPFRFTPGVPRSIIEIVANFDAIPASDLNLRDLFYTIFPVSGCN